MAELPVEQLARDAKALQIYAGTDELQITHIAAENELRSLVSAVGSLAAAGDVVFTITVELYLHR